VRTAMSRFSGASYLWGGVTPWGCDCSGLVQRAFALHGIALPRDAWQQATAGEPLPGEPGKLAGSVLPAASLLFFTDRDDRRVTHVGIATGDGGMVHSALARGGVTVERMASEDEYVTRLRAGCTGVVRPSAGRSTAAR
jgi:gamma-D-glutamyl-L-lysine dipeptidyl-peptidase